MVWINRWVQLALIRNWKLFPVCTLIHPLYRWAGCMLCSLTTEGLYKEYRSKTGREVQLFWRMEVSGSLSFWQCFCWAMSFLLHPVCDYLFLLSVRLPICGSLESIQFNHHQAGSSLFLLLWSYTYSYGQKQLFKNSPPDLELTSCLLRYLLLFWSFWNLSTLGVPSFMLPPTPP